MSRIIDKQKYTWDIENVFNDIKRIDKVGTETNSDYVWSDLNNLKFLFQDLSNFNKEKRASHVETILDGILSKYKLGKTPKSSKNPANELQIVKNLIILSKKIYMNVSLSKYHYKLSKNKSVFKYRPNELEIVFFVRDTFNSFDKNLLNDFDMFMDSGRINIGKNNFCNNDFIYFLKSINKSYSFVRNNMSFNDVDSLLYCFFKSKLVEGNSKRQYSVFDKTLELFFAFLIANKLKEKGYKEFYDIKYKLYNDYQRFIDDYFYIYSSDIRYDLKTNSYVVDTSSSLFDAELSYYYKQGVSFDQLMNPLINVYSYLLATYLYEQNKLSTYKTVNDIAIIINNMGLVSDEKLLSMIGVSFDQLGDLDYYEEFMDNTKKEYKIVKKKRKKQYE